MTGLCQSHHSSRHDLAGVLPRLVGRKTGVLKGLRTLLRGPDDPRLHVAIGELTETRRYLDCYGEVSGTGVGLTENQALMAAVGEAVEGYCAYDIQAPLVRASYEEICRMDPFAVSPEELPLYSSAQYRAPDFRFSPFTRDTVIRWATGRSYLSGQTRSLPAALVYISYSPDKDEERICHTIFGGIASGTSHEAALLSGLYEAVERDAMMIWWLNQLPMPRILPESGSRLSKVYEECFSGTGLSFELWQITMDIDIPVFFGLVTDGRNNSVAGGFGTNLNPEVAALKAMFECVQNRLGQLPMGKDWGKALYNEKAGREILGNTTDLAGKGKFSDINHLNMNLQLYLDPEMHRRLDTIRSSRENRPLSGMPNRSSGHVKKDLEICTAMLREKGFDVIVTDLTHEDVAELGFIVLRISVPGLVPNSVTAWPYLGNPRLYRVPADLGFKPKTETQMANFPMPYA